MFINYGDLEVPRTPVSPEDVAEEKDKKFDEFYSGSQMWAVSGGDSFFPCAKTDKELPSGQYIIQWSDAKGIYFTKKEINLDKLLVLPDSKAEKVLASIDHFWSCEDKFREHGFLWKRGILLFGPPGCLAADTFIGYDIRRPDGEIFEHKGGTIEHLYKVFNGNDIPEDHIFYVSSADENGWLISNRILNVLHSGVKDCFEIETISGYKLQTTADHKFYMGSDEYVALKDLMIGDNVVTTNAIAYTVLDDTIKSIKFVGQKETYDLCMAAPYNNFVAQNFVVKNSGKTVLCQQLSKQIVDRGGISVYLSEPKFTAEGLRVLRLIEKKRPIVVMIEDIDAIVERNGESNLLALLDGELQIDRVCFVATTNYPEKLDKRLVNRPSRFDEIIKIGMPSAAAREQYLKCKVLRLAQPEAAAELKKWVDGTKEYSIAHLREVIISVECLGNKLEKTLLRLEKMNNIKATSEDSGRKMGFAPAGFEEDDD